MLSAFLSLQLKHCFVQSITHPLFSSNVEHATASISGSLTTLYFRIILINLIVGTKVDSLYSPQPTEILYLQLCSVYQE